MENLAYYDGKIGRIEDMSVPMTDRACYFGDGIYEAALARNRRIFGLRPHVERMFRSAAALRIPVGQTIEEIEALLLSLLAQVDGSEQLVYWQLSRGVGPRAHVFPEGNLPGKLWVMISPHSRMALDTPARVITWEDTRFLHCNIKTLNLIPSVMAAQRAQEAGCYETILHRGDRVTECAHSNVHILKDGVFITAPADHLILAGITRAQMIELCGELGIPVEERPYTLQALMEADEVLITSSSTFGLSVSHIDGLPVGGRDAATVARLQRGMIARFERETCPAE